MVSIESLNESRFKSALSPATWTIEGTFDCSLAGRLSAAVSRAATRVVLDFRRVDGFRDAALGNLADLLKHYGPSKISLTGLRSHQRRILRYLGVDPDLFDRV